MYEQRKKKIINWIESIECPEVLGEIESIAIKNSKEKKIRVKQNGNIGLTINSHPLTNQTKENCCSDSEIEYLKKYFNYLHKKKR